MADFSAALHAKNDARALRAVEEIRDLSSSARDASDPSPETTATALLHDALVHQRPRVVRAVVRDLGAHTSLDTLVEHSACQGAGTEFGRSPLHEAVAAGGLAICLGVPLLSLCVELGADLSIVCRRGDYVDGRFSVQEYSAVAWSILHLKDNCLDYLLGDCCPSAFAHFESVFQTQAALSLMGIAAKGSSAIPVFRVLMKHGVNLRALETAQIFGQVGQGLGDGGSSMADVILMQARQAGDARFVRFLVREVGMRGNTESAMAMASGPGNGVPGQYDPGTRLDELLQYMVDEETVKKGRKTTVGSKYLCSTCGTTCATKICKGCKESRYCSVTCQTAAWNSGHKQQCKELRRLAVEGRPGRAESSAS